METLCQRLFWLAAPLFLLTLITPVSSLSANQTITALPGDDVPLTCVAPADVSFEALEVIKRGLEGRYVFFLMDNRPDVENQHPSYRGRVELVKPLVKNNNVSLIIRNITRDDSGVYECHFITNGRETDGNGSFGTKSSYNINLVVSDQTDGGVKGRGDLRNKDGGNMDGGNTTGRGATGTDQELMQRLFKAVLFIVGSTVAVLIIIKIW